MPALRIVILVKAPLPGFAKTRLIPALGQAGAAALADKLLRHTIEQALAAKLGPVEVCVAPSLALPVWSEYVYPVQWSEQGEGDLGERMARVSMRLAQAEEPLALIGTDCPQLTAQCLQQAAAALAKSDVCLVPVADGGYSLLGLNRHVPQLFQDIPWSSSQVMEATLRQIDSSNARCKLLPVLHDIDEPADLKYLPPSWTPWYQ